MACCIALVACVSLAGIEQEWNRVAEMFVQQQQALGHKVSAAPLTTCDASPVVLPALAEVRHQSPSLKVLTRILAARRVKASTVGHHFCMVACEAACETGATGCSSPLAFEGARARRCSSIPVSDIVSSPPGVIGAWVGLSLKIRPLVSRLQ